MIRRHDHLLCRWLPSGLEVAVPGRKAWLRLSEDLRQLLHAVGNGVNTEHLLASVGENDRDQLGRAIDELLRLGILVRSSAAAGPSVLWQRWGQVTQRYHIESRDAYSPIGSPDIASLANVITAQDAPSAYKDYPGVPAIELPRQLIPLTTPLEDAFMARRTCRKFADAPLTMHQLGTLLFHTFSHYRVVEAGAFGVLQSKASPAAGARHEVEAYVVVFNVSGLAPGLYHYGQRTRVLRLLNDEVPRERIAEIAYQQSPSYDAPISIFTTAVTARLSWKYRHPRAYRLWMYDAGHYGQTFALTATAMGLGPFQTVMFNDSAAENLLGVDSDDEFAVYLLTAGVPYRVADN